MSKEAIDLDDAGWYRASEKAFAADDDEQEDRDDKRRVEREACSLNLQRMFDTSHGTVIVQNQKGTAMWFLITSMLEDIREKLPPGQVPSMLCSVIMTNGGMIQGALTLTPIRGLVKVGGPAATAQGRPDESKLAEHHVYVEDIADLVIVREVPKSILFGGGFSG